jgi:hypothetical protein
MRSSNLLTLSGVNGEILAVVGSGATSQVPAVVGCSATSRILSVRWEAESRLPSVWAASIACTCGGSRVAQIVRRKSSGTLGASCFRCRKNWDGFLSPISSSDNSCLTCCSREVDNRRTSSSFRRLYGSCSGGSVMISFTSVACCWCSWDTMWLNLDLWRVMPAISNCASTCANHRAGRSGQKGGRRTATQYSDVSTASSGVSYMLILRLSSAVINI